MCQFLTPLCFSNREIKITDAEISKLLHKGVITRTVREQSDYVSGFVQGPKELAITEWS